MDTQARRYLMIDGQLVELWEDPEERFGWAPANLKTYAQTKNWSLLFNALVLGFGAVPQGSA